MFYFAAILFLLFGNAFCSLWSKGIVHYSINPKDYDPHSQEVIISTFQKIQNEICVKFFSIPVNYTAEKGEKVLHIHNPNKIKTCAPQSYDFDQSVIEMPVGYKCLNERDLTKLVVDMLKASIHKTQTVINSADLIQKFEEKSRLENPEKITLLNPNDRNYINAHYFQECGGLTQRSAPSRRNQREDGDFTSANKQYYGDKTWPFGIVIYQVNETMRSHPGFSKLLDAMRTIEMDTCIMFQTAEDPEGVLNSKHKIIFSDEGPEWPYLGYLSGTQTVNLSSIAGCTSPGHTSHTLMMLMRILGVPMMSNRFDRDNYIKVHWKNVQKGKEHYLEKTPEAAWLRQIPYDFNSVTHAPATFLCPGCLTKYTVEPIQDHLWQRTLTMGRTMRLSPGDVNAINTIYTEECQARVMPMAKKPIALAGVDEDTSSDQAEIPSDDGGDQGQADPGAMGKGAAPGNGTAEAVILLCSPFITRGRVHVRMAVSEKEILSQVIAILIT